MKKAKVLCLVICFIFAFSVMLTACTPKETETSTQPSVAPSVAPIDPGPTQPAEVGKPDRIDLTKTFYFGDSTEHLFYKREFMDWFTERYGIKLVVHYPSRNNFLEVINLAAMSGDLIGLVHMFSVPELFIWANEGLIYPLTDFLKDNEVWNTKIPEFWKEDVTMDGEIWAIPAGTDMRPSYFARSIRGDWLDNVGLRKPDTIPELYEAIYKFTYNDPNKSGANDTIGMTARTSWLMGDIYMAFDCRVNHLNDPMPNYNPNTEIWEDPMIKPEMVECLTWIKKCYDEGILDPELYTAASSVIRGRMSNGYAGTIFDWVHQINSFETGVKTLDPNAYFVSIGALKGTTPQNQKINFYGIGSGNPWAMMKTTPQPKEVANWFVNIFFGSAEGVFVGRFGVMGSMRDTGYFTIEGNKIYANYLPATAGGNPTAYPQPGIIGGHPDYELDRVYEYVYNSPDAAWNKEMTDRRTFQQTRLNQIFDEYNALGRLWGITEALKEPSCDLWLNKGVRGDQSAAANEALSTSITGSVPISEAIAKYREIAKAINMQQVLDTANEKLGKTSTQKY